MAGAVLALAIVIIAILPTAIAAAAREIVLSRSWNITLSSFLRIHFTRAYVFPP